MISYWYWWHPPDHKKERWHLSREGTGIVCVPGGRMRLALLLMWSDHPCRPEMWKWKILSLSFYLQLPWWYAGKITIVRGKRGGNAKEKKIGVRGRGMSMRLASNVKWVNTKTASNMRHYSTKRSYEGDHEMVVTVVSPSPPPSGWNPLFVSS